MKLHSTIPVVDLFAGPGGLGEGFSSVEGDPFRIIVSAEMEASAHSTLLLRTYFRLLKRNGEGLEAYYRFCNGESELPYDIGAETEKIWGKASKEARQLTLGHRPHDDELDLILKQNGLSDKKPWVLIGGPPCQAYSVVGRARNKGILDYRLEEDPRSFLYREYLRIIQEYRPAVFVMENVKGILSASLGDKKIFHMILQDLADPDRARGLAKSERRCGYRIHSLVDSETYYVRNEDPKELDKRKYIIEAEKYGIPQARHRVILLGVREDLDGVPGVLTPSEGQRNVHDAIYGLPHLRSRLSREQDGAAAWHDTVQKHFRSLQKQATELGLEALAKKLRKHGSIPVGLPFGSVRFNGYNGGAPDSPLRSWYVDKNLRYWLNHEARGHKADDLLRYGYASCFAAAYNRSPKGHKEFQLDGLRPDHKNWESGKFSDRFKVQRYEEPATTITSHIAKDGHYFIHPDPSQCRSLTVREAARLQTFKDNYFFQGNRTEQFHQVGNAVPPLLARQIGDIVAAFLQKKPAKRTLHREESVPA